MNTHAHKPTAPRHYAQALVEADGDDEQQRSILAACPADWRALAMELATSAIAIRQSQQSRHISRQSLLRPAPKAAPVYVRPAPCISHFNKSSPDVAKNHIADLRAAIAQKEPA
jgi:hypothetical protein